MPLSKSQGTGLWRGEPSACICRPRSGAHQISFHMLSNDEAYEVHNSNNDNSSAPYSSDYQDDVLNRKFPFQLKIASLNCRGLSSASRRERVVHLMKKHAIDILCLQETKINSNAKECHDKYVMFWSSGIKDEDRNKAADLWRSGKASSSNRAHAQIFRNAIEHLGVGIVYAKHLEKYVVDIRQRDARNIMLTLRMQAGYLDIISTYAPQACHRDADAAEKHDHELSKLVQIHYSYSPRIILGDFNARLIKALPHEASSFGSFTLGKSWADLDSLSDSQLNNRALFAEFCLAHNMIAKNTVFQKSDAELVTYKAVGVKNWQPPWQLHKYAQMDYVLINNRWKNAITDVNTTHVHAVDTDHKMLVATTRFKLKSVHPQRPTLTQRYRTPTDQQLTNYNDQIFRKAELEHFDAADPKVSMDFLNNLILHSAQSHLPTVSPAQKKPYISADTWTLLERKWAAVEAGEVDEADRYTELIKNRVQKDKEEHLLEQLETMTSQGYKWDGLKRLRNKFTPAFTKFKDADGNHVPFKNYPQKAAEYLRDVQWKPSDTDSFPSRLHIPLQNGRYQVDDSAFHPC